MIEYDAIVIGTGQAGPSLAARFAAAGKKTAVIERHLFGGTCVNTGCTPTKTLVASAKAAHQARRASDYGVLIDGAISVDMKKVKARKDAIVAQGNNGVENWMKNTDNITVYEGHGSFEGPNTVSVNGDVLTAKQIFINVGGRAVRPPDYEGVPVLTNTEMMEFDYVPEDLVVVGGSYIGLEFGQMYNRFGSKVTIVEMGDRLLKREDPDVSEAVEQFLKDEGIEIRTEATCLNGKMEGDKIALELDCKTGENRAVTSHLLLATGRKPNTDDLGLDKAGIETDDRGYIKVNDKLETNVPGVYALGDCNGQGAFTHTAYNDFEIVAENLLDGDDRKVSDRILCYGLYTDPALARIGMNEAQVRKSGRKALIGMRPMSKIARAKEKGETYGFMKILVDAETERILGATILGIEGDEIIHSLLDIMYANVSYQTIRRAVHIHPTVSELIPTVLGSLKPLE